MLTLSDFDPIHRDLLPFTLVSPEARSISGNLHQNKSIYAVSIKMSQYEKVRIIKSRGGMHNEDVPLGLSLTPYFSRCAMLLNAQISGILASTLKLT